MNRECVLVLEDIRSVENVGSIFRTAEGLGVRKVILVGTTPTPLDRFGRKRKDFAKVALGAENSIAWEYQDNIQIAINNLKKDGYKIISLEQHPKAKRLESFEVDKPKRFALVVGNEVDGVSREALEASDEIVEIKMKGKKESLNVSVALGIALFTFLLS